MRTLQQVEPRTPIHQLPYVISEPGSYYVVTNLVGMPGSDGIILNARNVSLDLNGFTLGSSDGAGRGIYAPSGVSDVFICNGMLTNWNTAIELANDMRDHVHRVSASDNDHGIRVGMESEVIGCQVNTCRLGHGIYAATGSQVLDSTTQGNGGSGIYTEGGNCHVRKCRVGSNLQYGIRVTEGSCVEENQLLGNGWAQIEIAGSLSRITGNRCINGSTVGLHAAGGSGNYFADNEVRGHQDNYDLASGNQLNLRLGEVPEVIEWPCSITFAGALTCSSGDTNAITVQADDVTIDLGGHTLYGPTDSAYAGIYCTGNRLCVRNGIINGWGGGSLLMYGSGVAAAQGTGHRLEQLRVTGAMIGLSAGNSSAITDCSVEQYGLMGISIGMAGRVESCLVTSNRVNLGYGIVASDGNHLADCVVDNGGIFGISALNDCVLERCIVRRVVNGRGIGCQSHAVLADCVASSNYSEGFFLGAGSSIKHSVAAMNGGRGFDLSQGCSVIDCVARNNGTHGIVAPNDCLIRGNNCEGNGAAGNGAGIYVNSAGCRVEDNTCVLNDSGIEVVGNPNLIIANSCRFNNGFASNYVIQAGNNFGQIVVSPGVNFVNSNPWANFAF